MDVFNLRDGLVEDYREYAESFVCIRDERIRSAVDDAIEAGLLWPAPLVQLNPAFEPGEWIDELVSRGVLHAECSRIFRANKGSDGPDKGLRLHRHQVEAIEAAKTGESYVLTTGTGSGKSLTYIVPIVDHVLRRGSGRGIQAIVVYPMNALANSQSGELEKFLCHGYPDGRGPVTFARYTGQESDEERRAVWQSPPDILLTNYVMLELILTRPEEKPLIAGAQGLRFLVLDELHTYRGRQGADVAFLVRRVRDRTASPSLQCVGTSATLAGGGTPAEQRREVARVATQLFGVEVKPERIIGETLRRVTPPRSYDDRAAVAELRERVERPRFAGPMSYDEYVSDPLSSWIETALGVAPDAESDRLVRARPKPIRGPRGAATELAALTSLPEDQCARAIEEALLASYKCAGHPETEAPPFAFRLHQFMSRGDTVYASPEDPAVRKIAFSAQQFVPGDRERVLLPLAFCRECGHEFYVVRAESGEAGGEAVAFGPRDLSDLSKADGTPGFLYVSADNPWPSSPEALVDRVPEDWIDESTGTVRSDRRKYLPQPLHLTADGRVSRDGEGIDAAFLPAPFRFCPACGVGYSFDQKTDFPKLSQLGAGGRSTATTILSLATIQRLKADGELPPRARKLLSFTDNRQDASLQSGHFNDFVEVGLLRSALYRAVLAAGDRGLRHDELAQRVFEALDLPLEAYARDPDVRFAALEDTQAALRGVLGYRLYRDLERGWRITLPNLEQCDLLRIEYRSLDELCRAEDVWADLHPALAGAAPETREVVAKVLLDFLRRSLAIKVSYLDQVAQERIRQQSDQRLIAPWSLDENEDPVRATIAFPRSRRKGDYGGHVFLSGRGGFARYLRRPQTLREHGAKISVQESERIIRELLAALRLAGLVEEVQAAGEDGIPGYQVPASALVWKAGKAERVPHDPIRVPNAPATSRPPNPFFVNFYRSVAPEIRGVEAREHTAQVPSEVRQERENRFREAKLPILFCSPTMELGVDISELNVVGLRNIPPTPANYAQRSGRAGRSGQPALVYGYCTTGSPHDQYFFRRPELMVAGAVNPPRLELANEDLVRAHVHAVWLAETGLSLGRSLTDVLDVAGENPTLELQAGVRQAIADPQARMRARARAQEILSGCRAELEASDWWSDGWLDETLGQIGLRFEAACARWRDLYRAAHAQAKAQGKVIRDASAGSQEKEQAKRLRNEAEQQLSLLTDVDKIAQSDFYSYRYFAGEGFLPGYSFPRLPLSAYIPARRGKGEVPARRRRGEDEFVSRPRFLALSEFGPRAIVYHEGSRYRITRAVLPVRTSTDAGDDVMTQRAKLCPACGYLHPVGSGGGPDLCESCETPLPPPMTGLFRMQNVTTRRVERINADEEERQRLGYDIITGVRFAERGGQRSCRAATLSTAAGVLARATYGAAATLWRVNLGWSRRADKDTLGFVIDMGSGTWARNQEAPDDEDQDPLGPRLERVVPFVEDHRNCLILDFADRPDAATLLSLQAALKRGIQAAFELEDSELAAECLPSDASPRRILFYEAAEGGAGALRRLLDDPAAFGRVAWAALEICHFDPETGQDRHRAEQATEECEAACYDCLMSYQNQRHHRSLDRQLVRDTLLSLTGAEVAASPVPAPRSVHLERLKRGAGSDLERAWLDLLQEHNLRLPSDGQVLVEACGTRPDFLYREQQAAVYIDGPHHEFPERRARDAAQTACMEDLGYLVLRFGHRDDWPAIIERYPYLFGREG
ncbi:MAG: DEAD/DEAH box helicase [Thermoleophilia bacterium]